MAGEKRHGVCQPLACCERARFVFVVAILGELGGPVVRLKQGSDQRFDLFVCLAFSLSPFSNVLRKYALASDLRRDRLSNHALQGSRGGPLSCRGHVRSAFLLRLL